MPPMTFCLASLPIARNPAREEWRRTSLDDPDTIMAVFTLCVQIKISDSPLSLKGQMSQTWIKAGFSHTLFICLLTKTLKRLSLVAKATTCTPFFPSFSMASWRTFYNDKAICTILLFTQLKLKTYQISVHDEEKERKKRKEKKGKERKPLLH